MDSESKIAIVSEKIIGTLAGSEMALFALLDLFPEAPIYTVLHDLSIIPEQYKNRTFHSTFIQNLPFSKRLYKSYFPIMPFAVELLDLQEYDIIISSHHCVAKGIIPRPDAYHICYCYSPARYIWDLFWTYSNEFNNIQKILLSAVLNYIRVLDVISSNRVDLFLTISNFTAARIKKYYNRDSEVVSPPVETTKFSYESSGDYYLMVGRLVGYKGFDLAVETFNQSGKRLIIIGDGEDYNKLKSKANSNISMPGKVDDKTLIKHFNNCKAFIFPGVEDFGIVMVEAQAAGKPVIALNKGGALDIVRDNETGILFKEGTISALNQAILKSENINWDHKYITSYAKKFDKQEFYRNISNIIERVKNLETSA